MAAPLVMSEGSRVKDAAERDDAPDSSDEGEGPPRARADSYESSDFTPEHDESGTVKKYVPPSLIPRISDYPTIDIAPVRLSPDIDPRRQTTRRTRTVQRVWQRYQRPILFMLCTVGVVFAMRLLHRCMNPISEQSSRAPAAASLVPVPSPAARPEAVKPRHEPGTSPGPATSGADGWLP